MRKGVTLPDSLQDRLEKRIARKRGDVFLRADFDDLGGYDQVGRVLRGLVRKGRLMKIGQGLYTRAHHIVTSTASPCRRRVCAHWLTEALRTSWRRDRADPSAGSLQ